jgi:hypothetical protein
VMQQTRKSELQLGSETLKPAGRQFFEL